MSIFARLQTMNEGDKSRAVEKLISDATPDWDYFFFVVLSVLMATFGMLLDNVAVIIGSMLIAPILYPILSFSLGIIMADQKIMMRSVYAIARSFVLGVVAAAGVTLLFVPFGEAPTYEILLRVQPSLEYFAVAVISGIAVSVSLPRPQLSSTLIGIAVSVALIPPIAVVGIGLAQLSWAIVSGSFVLFLINVIGIMFASMVTFSLMNLYVKKRVAETAVKKEERRIEREQEEIKKLDEEAQKDDEQQEVERP